jgi:CBS domain containing-hemolysin-like protein
MTLSEEELEKFTKPIVNASYPGTMAALMIAALQFGSANLFTHYAIVLSAVGYLVTSFSIFFYSLYPTRIAFRIVAATSFLISLTFSLFAVLSLMFV